MFLFYSAAHHEDLLNSLVETVKKRPLSVFAQECFLVGNAGQERWLSQQLAEQFQVFANYQFWQPEQFFRQLARKIGQDLHNPEFDRELMQWRIESLLRNLEDEIFSPLKQYCHDNSMKRYQLAGELARLFENYQLFRPELLDEWNTNLGLYSWQQALWQKITEQTGTAHQGKLWQQAIEKLQNSPEKSFKYQLPQRLFVFGINHLPPLWLKILHAVSKHCDIYFYWLNPLPERTESLHPLLASLGQQTLDFQKSLSTVEHDCQSSKGLAVVTRPSSLLQQLQHDLSQPQTFQVLKTWKVSPDDNSISIHACHSRMREIEVVKNQLLHSLEKNPDLQLRDIVVTAPNIQDYAPFISAVFADIPHQIAGRRMVLNSMVLDAFIRFLKLCDSRFGWQAVLDLLELQSVYPNFALEETDLELIKYWLSDTNVRWGKSAEHRAQLNLPPLSENTWQHSLERLLMGYAVSNDDVFVNKILPYKNIEGSSAQVLGGLCAFMDLLFQASAELTQAKTLQGWSESLFFYTEKLFAQISPTERQELQALLADFAEKFSHVHQNAVALPVIIHWLEQAVSEQKLASGLLRGQLTFCSMQAVRGIPFQVIAVLGMNDGDFPRADRHLTFDEMAKNPQLGDPSARAEDRQQFLELLLSARQQLLITYIGQSLAENQSIPPSVVLSELLEVLEFDYQLKADEFVVKQPLQPFSVRYFNQENPKLWSYSQADYETALALNSAKPEAKIWWQGTIPTEANEFIELADMMAFYRNPQRYFLRRQLDLRLENLQSEPDEREPFTVDGLENYSINHDWIDALLENKAFSVEKLKAQGCWLSGVMGEVEFIRREAEIIEFVETIQQLNLGEKLPDIALDEVFFGYRLQGKLSNLYENGSLFYRFASLKGKDLLIALLHHGLMNAAFGAHKTYIVSSDDLLILTPDLYSPERLESLITLYLQGQQRPDALFTESVLVYVKQVGKKKATLSPLDAARKALQDALENDYQPELSRLYSLATEEDFNRLLGDEFEDFCKNLILPIWQATHAKEA